MESRRAGVEPARERRVGHHLTDTLPAKVHLARRPLALFFGSRLTTADSSTPPRSRVGEPLRGRLRNADADKASLLNCGGFAATLI